MSLIHNAHRVIVSALLGLAACSGGTQDDGNAAPAAADRVSPTMAQEPDAASSPGESAAAPVANDSDGEYPAADAPDATPPAAPHSTRLVMRDDGLYAHDADNNWRKLENGVWVSVQAPQGAAAQ